MRKQEKNIGDEYDYSEVIYINNYNKVKIICSKHGIFEQVPVHHMNRGDGCPSCVHNKKPTTKEFIDSAKNVHDIEYDYSEVIYINSYTKVKIICPKHGTFWQTPANHMNRGDGCSKCSNNISESEIKWLNSINIPDDSEHRQARIYINKFNASGKKKYYVVDRF